MLHTGGCALAAALPAEDNLALTETFFRRRKCSFLYRVPSNSSRILMNREHAANAEATRPSFVSRAKQTPPEPISLIVHSANSVSRQFSVHSNQKNMVKVHANTCKY